MKADLIDSLKKTGAIVFDVQKKLNRVKNIPCSYIDGSHPRMKSPRTMLHSEQQCFCAHNKIFLAEEYLKSEYQNILVMDVDCIFRGSIEDIFSLPGEFVVRYHEGRMPPPYKNLTSFKEGCMLIKNAAGTKDMFFMASQNIKNKMKNMQDYHIDTDHIELAKAFELYKKKINMSLLPKKFKDTSFEDQSIMWSGKGDRKDNSKKYKACHEQYYDLFLNR